MFAKCSDNFYSLEFQNNSHVALGRGASKETKGERERERSSIGCWRFKTIGNRGSSNLKAFPPFTNSPSAANFLIIWFKANHSPHSLVHSREAEHLPDCSPPTRSPV